MNRYLVLTIAIAVSLSATPVALNFGSIPGSVTPGNQGTSLVPFPLLDPSLTVTAKSGITSTTNGTTPNEVIFSAFTGTVFWDDLGDLKGDVSCGGMGASCIGLGVQDSTAMGSKGISGDGGDQDEALIFSFGGGAPVPLNSIILTMLGLTASGMDQDYVWLFVEYDPSNGTPSDVVHALNISDAIMAGEIVNFSTIGALNSSMSISKLAVYVQGGHAGVGGLQYDRLLSDDPVPEPATFGLVSAGLLLAAFSARRLRRR